MAKTSFMQRVQSTMKSPDTEGPFELYVTRTPGYLWALFFRRLGVHPIAVTLASIILGVAAAVFMGFDSLEMNLIGMGLLVWANWYDCADGQLARMTGKKTLLGRILDGFAGDVWFFFIYLFLSIRLHDDPMPFFSQYTWGPWIYIFCTLVGVFCHAVQCQMADYYRNVHLYFLPGARAELDRSIHVRKQYESLEWLSGDWFSKLYLFFYVSYTRAQERRSPLFQALFARIRQRRPEGDMPDELRRRFRQGSLPLMPLTNILTFDTRVGVLFLSLLAGEPWVYVLFEAVVLQPLLYYMIARHEALCKETIRWIDSQPQA